MNVLQCPTGSRLGIDEKYILQQKYCLEPNKISVTLYIEREIRVTVSDLGSDFLNGYKLGYFVT